MKKSTKTFKCSDPSQNVYGMRVRTEGIRLDGFLENPVCLLNHNYDKVLGNWTDVELVGDALIGVPVIDDDDPEAALIGAKIERDIIKGVSIGIIPIKVEGNEIIESDLLEMSITPVPANRNALVMYNKAGTALNVSDARLYLLSISNNAGNSPTNIVEKTEVFWPEKAKNTDQLSNISTDVKTLNWSFDDYIKHDPVALSVMQEKEPQKFNTLYSSKAKSLIAQNPGAYKSDSIRLLDSSHSRAEQTNVDRKNWTFDDYATNDPVALSAMQDANPDGFTRLYSQKIKAVRANGLIAL